MEVFDRNFLVALTDENFLGATSGGVDVRDPGVPRRAISGPAADGRSGSSFAVVASADSTTLTSNSVFFPFSAFSEACTGSKGVTDSLGPPAPPTPPTNPSTSSSLVDRLNFSPTKSPFDVARSCFSCAPPELSTPSSSTRGSKFGAGAPPSSCSRVECDC